MLDLIEEVGPYTYEYNLSSEAATPVSDEHPQIRAYGWSQEK